jgi:hypothetical protein
MGRSAMLAAGMVLAVVAAFGVPPAAADTPAVLQLAPGARIGVINLLDPEVTHFHASRQIENSFLKTYPVGWRVDLMLLAAVRERLTQLSLVPVPLAPGDDLSRARESCFLEAALARGLPKACVRTYAQFAAAQRVQALIVLGPGRNNSAHAGGGRHRELPEYLRGWCFVTGKGEADSAPALLNFTELLLIDTNSGEVRLASRQWGGDAGEWSGYRAPPDLKAFPGPLLDELQPRFAAILQQQATGLFAHLQVNR